MFGIRVPTTRNYNYGSNHCLLIKNKSGFDLTYSKLVFDLDGSDSRFEL